MGHVWFWMMGSHRGPGEEFSDAAGCSHKCQGLLSRQGQFVLKTISATGHRAGRTVELLMKNKRLATAKLGFKCNVGI